MKTEKKIFHMILKVNDTKTVILFILEEELKIFHTKDNIFQRLGIKAGFCVLYIGIDNE